MFEVSDEEMIELAQAHDMQAILHLNETSLQAENRMSGVSWTKFGFRKLE